jgi:RNA polymerase sigma-70 factor (ECF subfamily)
MIHKTAARKSFETEAFPHLEALWQTSLWLTENEDAALTLVKESFVKAFRFWSHSVSETDCRQLLFKTLAKLFFSETDRYTQMPQELNADDSDQCLFYDKLPLMKAIPGQVINKAISGLLAEVKFVTILSMLWGFSYKEIARIADIDREVVQTRLYLGRRLIRRELYKFMTQTSNLN